MKLQPIHYTNIHNTPRKQLSFKSASDISLQYVYDNRMYCLPERMKIEIKKAIENKKHNENLPSLRELHTRTYNALLNMKSLEEVKNYYPEFSNILNAKTVITKGSKNTKIIENTISLNDLSLYILKERWANLKTENEIAHTLGLKNRSALGWILNQIKMPELGTKYQSLLKASDEKLNKEISQRTKNYNKSHPSKMIDHNRLLAQRPEIIALNKELADEMWARMPELKEAMRVFRSDNPKIRKEDFAEAFWQAHPEYKKQMSEIRKEIGYERRTERLKDKQKAYKM